ncbi:alpha/beta hydrolase [Nocardioides aurantiacus]|uniref:Alpha/beta hydrolase family protein n=1 Tax=Nocardioides aurantiacus TaxID=86796 RepID=A0A3N2CYD1_9ACTN|nr:alpha/beta hydrolase [Nocardioides aurantiacus]ROR92550.1 alpha/beta hydrolase family protein [Nocardioides aurantiacus]
MSDVVIEIPASRPDLVEPTGDPDQADSLASRLYRAASRYQDFSEEATQLGDLNGTWWGEAYDAYQGAAGGASEEHARMSDTVRRVGRAVSAYADNLREHDRTYEELVDAKSTADQDRQQLEADVRAATDVSDAEITALQQRAGALDGRYRDLVRDHDALTRRVRDNEDTLRQAFVAGTSLTSALSADGGIPSAAQSAMGAPGAPGDGATPEQVAAWWRGLSEAEQEAVVAAYPQTVGGADGLPASARDEANRILLEDDLARLEAKEDDGTLSALEQRMLENARATRTALDDADGYVDPLDPTVRPGAQLWLYDPSAFDGDGRVAVAVGDMDTADDVAVFTPGIKTEMTDVQNYTGDMMNLHESSRYQGDRSDVATMFWLGYDAPAGPTDLATATESRAADGGARLADAIDGMRASRADDPASMTAIGHSYGSTTTAYAATENGLDVDRIALIGSPGAGRADHAEDLGVGSDDVFVGRDSRDKVARLGDEGWASPKDLIHPDLGLGNDPSEDEFGAQRFEAESIFRSEDGSYSEDHGRYFDVDSESLYNLGRIVDGDTGNVNAADHSTDPFFGSAEDPEEDRDPTSGEPGRSQTRPID